MKRDREYGQQMQRFVAQYLEELKLRQMIENICYRTRERRVSVITDTGTYKYRRKDNENGKNRKRVDGNPVRHVVVVLLYFIHHSPQQYE